MKNPPTPVIKDRIKGFKRIPGGSILQNTKNHRRHPLAQRQGLRGMLSDVGMASACVVRPLKDGKYELIDGHLRHDLLKGQDVPCLIVDVTAKESDKLLATMDAISGMAGVDSNSLHDLLDGLESSNAEAKDLLQKIDPHKPEPVEEADVTLDDKIDSEPNTQLEAMGPNVATFTNNVVFLPTKNKWDIPELDNKLIPKLPQPIDTWAGDVVCDPAESDWWLYITSTGTRGLPFDRSVVGFFCDDYRWDRIWKDPAKHVGALLNRGIKYAIEPNFSLYPNMPRVHHLYTVYKTRYLGRYMQEAGLQVIPCVQWADDETFEFACEGIPIGAKSIAVQLQTCEGYGFMVTTGKKLNKAELNVKGLQAVLDRVQPQQLVVYGAPKNVALQMNEIKYDGDVVLLKSHSYRRKQEKEIW